MRGIRLVTRDFDRVLAHSRKLRRVAMDMGAECDMQRQPVVCFRAALYRDCTGRLIARACWGDGGRLLRATDYGAHEL